MIFDSFEKKPSISNKFANFDFYFWSWKGRGVNLRKTWRHCHHKVINLFMVTKKICRKKKIHSDKKKYRWSPKGVSECGKKKIPPEKKNTAAQQKEWVSGSTIFSREIKKYETFGRGLPAKSFIIEQKFITAV